MTSQAQEEVLATFLASKGSSSGVKDCRSAVATLKKDAPETVEAVIDSAVAGELVDSVSIEGGTAIATIDESGARLEVELQPRGDEGWLVSEPQQLLFGAPP